ncbi:MAG: hypothetical protein KY391_00010 [Actinobacteria bacterium]|nr:hypothetical protein [Actinomycetota bacterium]
MDEADEAICAQDDDRYDDYDAIGEIEVTEPTTFNSPVLMGELRFEVVEPFLTIQPGRYYFVVSPAVGSGPVRLSQYLDYIAADPAG